MKKIFLLAIVFWFLPIIASAENVEIDGLLYKLIPKGHAAEVISKGVDNYGHGNYAGHYVGDIVIPASVNYEGESYDVTTIGSAAFSYCSITSVTIPNSVVTIANNAFANCEKLTSVVIPSSVTSLGKSAFEDCYNLLSVTIEGNITAINDWTFGYCKKLASVNIPQSVSSIGSYAFYECNTLTIISIGDKVESIGANAFFNCSSLASVNIPNSVTSLGNTSFSGCSSLVSVTIGTGVTSIGTGVFYGCSSLQAIEFPDNVQSISNDAFNLCSNLTSVTIGTGVTDIGITAFYKCTNIDSFIVKEGNGVFDSRMNCNAIIKTESNSLFLGCKSTVIPNDVTSIGDRAFWECIGLKTIFIPNNIKKIENRAFEGCVNLKSVCINDLVSWCTIPFNNLNNPLSIARHLYINGVEVEEYNISNNIESIGNYTFINCESIKKLTIPDNIISIGNFAFSGCCNLSKIDIPNSVTNIGECGFKGCTSLTSVIIGNGVTDIGKEAFQGCGNLSSIKIGKSVKRIDDYVFAKCANLTDVICLAKTVPAASTNVFQNSDIEYATLHVYESSVNSYKGSTPWNTFKSIVAIDDIPIYTITYMVDDVVYKTIEYEEGENITAVDEPTKEGYTFSGWSEIPETMPNHNVVITGTFVVNKYKLIYWVDGVEYKNYAVEYGSNITPETEPIKEGYTFSGWSEIPTVMPAFDVNVNGSFTKNAPTEQCDIPVIAFEGGKLIFDSDTEDAEFHYEIKVEDAKEGVGSEVSLSSAYEITVYASKEGYNDSEKNTATLYWINVDPTTTVVLENEIRVNTNAVLVQNTGGAIILSGVADDSDVVIYGLSGQMIAHGKASGNHVEIGTNLSSGDICIIKMGDKSVKYMLR